MASSFSPDRERVAIPVEHYIFDISGGVDTYRNFPGRPGVLSVVESAIQRYDRRLRVNINLGQRDFAEASDRVAGELAMLADSQKRAFNNPVNAAHLYRMASGAERVSRNNLGTHNEVIKAERAALEIIYMADAVQALREVGRNDTAFVWRLEQRESLIEAYRRIEEPGKVRDESSSPRSSDRLPDRVSEAYRRGRLIVAGI